MYGIRPRSIYFIMTSLLIYIPYISLLNYVEYSYMCKCFIVTCGYASTCYTI